MVQWKSKQKMTLGVKRGCHPNTSVCICLFLWVVNSPCIHLNIIKPFDTLVELHWWFRGLNHGCGTNANSVLSSWWAACALYIKYIWMFLDRKGKDVQCTKILSLKSWSSGDIDMKIDERIRPVNFRAKINSYPLSKLAVSHKALIFA